MNVYMLVCEIRSLLSTIHSMQHHLKFISNSRLLPQKAGLLYPEDKHWCCKKDAFGQGCNFTHILHNQLRKFAVKEKSS